jgi:hypothetical protein
MQSMTTRWLSVMLGVLGCTLFVAGVWGYFRADARELDLVSPSSGLVANNFSVGENTFDVVIRNNSDVPVRVVGFGEC